ncbi:hypothetical protein JCM8097_004529 [Rhodosporidiobolus ruineniae]
MPRALPPELLGAILEPLAPVDAEQKEYTARLADLRRCCLVSHAFRDIAQPLLRRFIRLRNHAELVCVKEALQEDPTFQRTVRSLDMSVLLPNYAAALALHGSNQDGEGVEQLRRVVVAHVWLSMQDLAVLMPGLLDLSIHACITFFDFNHSFVLSSLRSLSLTSVFLSSETLHAVLSPSATPSLRALALFMIRQSGLGESPLSASVRDGHLNWLEMLQFRTHPSYPHTDLAAVTAPVLFLLDIVQLHRLSDLDHLDMRHQQLTLPTYNPEDPYEDETVAGALDNLKAWLLRAPLARRTLFFPSDYRPSSALHPPAVLRAVEGLLDACGKGSVEVFWLKGTHSENEHRLNRGFWRYARRMKEKEA